ncbi:MAG: bifunctional diaminohydroxyphosphoribosylaminopyrimidine deaminase/5-amino-6-(5-phosphoribosylamino)uracil reductase RibD [Candidatus Sumerlaeaceae bacterium]|nr:bifunctional diaminohydroxyphosphoribosylaminopyrimidine deaminase/5-amino-6-(5-phosphoribosylamino)uracil reductase RibD [Candidatus Sumerlaeaceae bacterium]
MKSPGDKAAFSDRDLAFMRRALELAGKARGQTSPNPMVGAVLVKGGRIIGEGYHHGAGSHHAEIEALNAATGDVAGSTLFVTLEPCCHFGKTPPCAPVLVERGISRVVVPMADPNEMVSGKGFKVLKQAGIQVDIGLCEEEARLLNEAFLTYHLLKRPFVISKWAMTLDGRIATYTGSSKWISNEDSRRYVHEIRANVDAIMAGIGTVLLDNPQLNVRLDNFEGRQPRRVVVDGNLRIPTKARLFEDASEGQCIVATTTAAARDRIAKLRDQGHTVLVVPGRKGIVDVANLIAELHGLGIQSLLCEGGSSLNGSLFETHLVDKVIAFVAPKIVGGNNEKTPIAGWGVDEMDRALNLIRPTVRQFGGDICVEGYLPGCVHALKPAPRRPATESRARGESRSE